MQRNSLPAYNNTYSHPSK